jgi:microcystin-dependent protein
MAEPIGNIYSTGIPSLDDTANIQEALRIYHYGRPSGSNPQTEYNINNEELGDLVEDSIAFYLNDLQEQITNINSTFDPLAYSKKGNLVSADFDGNVTTLELSPGFPIDVARNGLVLTSDDSADTGLSWRVPEVTLSDPQNLTNKSFGNSSVLGGGALVGTTATQTLTNKTMTSPTINSPTISDATLSTSSVSGGGAVVGTTATQTLTNKTISLEPANNTITGILPVANGATPAGVISQYAGTAAPTGYLLCQGQSVSTTTFAALFAAIGYNYGGSGASFNVPNLQNRVPVGRGTGTFGSLNATGGAETHTLTVDQMPSHTHIQNSHNHTQNAHNHGASSGSAGSHSHSASTGTAGAHTHGNSGSHSHQFFYGTFVGRAQGTTSPLVQSSNVSVINDGTTKTSTHEHTSSGGHTHTVTVNANGDHSHTVSVDNATATNQAATATNQNTGGGEAHNNLQPYIVVNYIIKT